MDSTHILVLDESEFNSIWNGFKTFIITKSKGGYSLRDTIILNQKFRHPYGPFIKFKIEYLHYEVRLRGDVIISICNPENFQRI